MNVKYRYIHKKGQWNQMSSRRNYLINIANDQLWCAVNVRIVVLNTTKLRAVICTEYYKLPGSDPKYREESPVVRQPIITAV